MIEFAKIYGEWNNYYGNHTYQKLTNAACYYGYNFDELAHDSLEDVNTVVNQRKRGNIWKWWCYGSYWQGKRIIWSMQKEYD